MNTDPPAASSPLAEPAPARPGPARGAALGELARVFLKLGLIAFGGPAAHVGLMEHEFVRRRQWLTRERFADLLAATHLIPGPNSTEMALYVGQLRAGLPGLCVAGACFILPAVVLVMGLAWAYQRFGALPEVGGLLYGVKPVLVAIVTQALWSLGRTAVKTLPLGALGLAAVVLNVLGVHELVVLAGAGLAGLGLRAFGPRGCGAGRAQGVWLAGPVLGGEVARGPLLGAAATVGGVGAAFGLWPLFLFFLKVGAILYGSGYVLLAFLRADLVERWHWLTETQLLDAVAAGQITPGPLFTTATFIGYVLAGVPGALVATVGIFLPAFVFVAVSGPLLPRLRASATVAAVLDGIVVASLALMAVVTWHLGRAALCDLPTALLAGISVVVLLRFRVNSAWLVLAGAALGLMATLAGLAP